MHLSSTSAVLWLVPTALGKTGDVHHDTLSHADQHVLHAGAGADTVQAAQQLCYRSSEPLGLSWQRIGTCPTERTWDVTTSAAGNGGAGLGNETITASDTSEADEKDVQKQHGEVKTDDDENEGWIRATACYELPREPEIEFCTFTLRSFSNGEGISIITTHDTFDKISALPVFSATTSSSPSTHTTSSEEPPPYQAVPIQGKGLGLVSTRPIAFHKVYLSRTPAVVLDDEAFNRLGRARLTALLAVAASELPAEHEEAYMSLSTHVEEKLSREDTAYEVFMRNNFRTEVDGVGTFHSAFTDVSRINHACRPNSDYFFDDKTFTHNVFTARDVDAGEELTVTYADPVQTHSFRQNNLRQHWGFTCTCTHCTAPESQITLSDDRTTQIRDLWAILDDYSTTIPTTTPAPQDETTLPSPEKADRLIALYREEGLDTRMVEAYYRAAVENNGVGRAERAREFAGRAVREGEIMEAGIRPFLENMRALARDPEGHWTWRFRLRGSG